MSKLSALYLFASAFFIYNLRWLPEFPANNPRPSRTYELFSTARERYRIYQRFCSILIAKIQHVAPLLFGKTMDLICLCKHLYFQLEAYTLARLSIWHTVWTLQSARILLLLRQDVRQKENIIDLNYWYFFENIWGYEHFKRESVFFLVQFNFM